MTLEDKNRLVSHDEWMRMRPYMVMIHIDHWSEIKTGWKKACRVAGPECSITLESVDKVIKSLSKVIETIGVKKP